MRGRVLPALAVICLLASACVSRVASGPPSPGPGGGSVDVRPSTALAPGATVVLALAADDDDVGSACVTLDEWVDGGWRARWYWERSSPVAETIPDGEERTCPAIGIPLPTDQTVTLPADIPDGTWRVAYLAGEDHLGTYVFEVG